MKIISASRDHFDSILQIARSLPDWFTEEAIENLETDLEYNSAIIAVEDDMAIGFLCYTTYSGKVLLLWMGVAPQNQRTGIGTKLLSWLIEEGRRLKLHNIEVETLPDEDDYEPYKSTRDFYYKNGFKRTLYKKSSKKGWDDQILLEKEI